MKIIIIVKSDHRQNTLKIAEAMSEAAPITVVEYDNAENYNINDYDIVGFGSGIYAGKFSGKIIDYINENAENFTNAFVFSTSGTGKPSNNDQVVELLNNMGKNVLGSFTCRGLCKWFIFALVGGISKGHPDVDDFDAAQQFIGHVLEKYEATNSGPAR